MHRIKKNPLLLNVHFGCCAWVFFSFWRMLFALEFQKWWSQKGDDVIDIVCHQIWYTCPHWCTRRKLEMTWNQHVESSLTMTEWFQDNIWPHNPHSPQWRQQEPTGDGACSSQWWGTPWRWGLALGMLSSQSNFSFNTTTVPMKQNSQLLGTWSASGLLGEEVRGARNSNGGTRHSVTFLTLWSICNWLKKKLSF